MNVSRLLGLSLSVAALAATPSVRAADDAGKPAAKPAAGAGAAATPADRIKAVTSQLELTPEQMKKVEEISAEAKAKAAEIKPGPDAREKTQALRTEMIAKIRGLLTEAQAKKFDAIVAAASQPGAGGAAGANRGGAAGIVLLLRSAVQDLGLDEDQKAKVSVAFDDATKKLLALRDQAKGGQTPEVREKARAIFDDLRADIEKVLTPDQQQKLRDKLQNATNPGQRNGAGATGGKKEL